MTNIEPAASNLPALYSPSASIDANDVQISTIKFGHPQSSLCQEHDIKLGVVYAAAGQDDPDPQILWNPSAKGDNPGVIIHILDMEKYLSKVVDGEIERFEFGDPDAPEGCNTVYRYTVVVPSGDTELPYRMSLFRTKAAAARAINTVLVKNEGKSPAHHVAFELSTVNKKSDKGAYTVPRVRDVEATPEGIALADKLAAMIGTASGPAASSRTDEPAI